MRDKFINWYLSGQAMPYWCILFIDLAICCFSSFAAFFLAHGPAECSANLLGLAKVTGFILLCCLIGFRLFSTYSGVVRKSGFDDLVGCNASLAFAMMILMAVRLLFRPAFFPDFFRFSDLILFLFIAGQLMICFRIMARKLYDYYFTHTSRGGVYGLSGNALLDLEMNNLLPRDPIDVDMDRVAESLKGRRIMVTGAAGSIGSELSWLIASCSPASLILVDQAETPLHDVRLRMRAEWPGVRCSTIVTSICHSHRMERIFKEERPEIIFHAAAYKHVPMMEDNPVEAVLNNIDGTRKLADLAVKYSTRKFIMVSTDKAVNPTNVMGCSKRICEIYCQSLAKSQSVPTKFITTRFGNVLGSNGSVIPIFREQIRRGGPVKVTHPEINRFFMLIPEACRLVLEAARTGRNGQILVFDMGQPVKIVDLARRMIMLSGRHDVRIEFTGLRPGEKLYEEVLNDEETVLPTENSKIKIARVREYDFAEAKARIEKLIETARTYDARRTVALMRRIVPEYHTELLEKKINNAENKKNTVSVADASGASVPVVDCGA